MKKPVTPIHPDIGQQLHDWRASLGLGQKELASKANVSKATISQIEVGHSALTPQVARLLCQAFTHYMGRTVRLWHVWPGQFTNLSDQLDATKESQHD